MTTLSPELLRQALRQAGNILKPDEVNDVLRYVVKDKKLAELDQVYLVLTLDGRVEKLCCSAHPFSAQQQPMKKQFFIWRDSFSKDLYHLMDNKHQKVVESQGSEFIAG